MARLKWEYKDKVIRFSVSHEGQESEFYIDPRLVTLTCLSGSSTI